MTPADKAAEAYCDKSVDDSHRDAAYFAFLACHAHALNSDAVKGLVEVLEELAKYELVEYSSDNQNTGNSDDAYEHGDAVASGYCGEIARKALAAFKEGK